ncbi:uncharacterized protein At4g15970-like isoform X1 [Typha latifolia]|uniref:uncharacterized protein At4g15970-like isoform X1 n=1 Tax=Typha latifolia TaxID=4733 RepID=UPI003C2D5221
MTTDLKSIQPKLSVLLWAATATVILLFYLSARPRRVSSEISAWSNGIDVAVSTPSQHINTTHKVEYPPNEEIVSSTPAQQVNITQKIVSSTPAQQVNITQKIVSSTPAQQVNITQKIGSSTPADQQVNIKQKIVSSTPAQDVKVTKEIAPIISEPIQDLRWLLRRAAMDDKTVILTEVNEAWAAPNSLLDAFFESFRIGEGIAHLLQHVIIVAMDPKAFAQCKLVHPHCYMLRVEGVNLTSEKTFGSKDFLELVWTKVKLQQSILQLGYNFLFTDLDVMWFRNPFEIIEPSTDFMLSCDVFLGNAEDVRNYPNTGFIYMKSNKKDIKVLKYWNKARKQYPTMNEQNVFNKIKHELVAKIPVKMQFVDTKYLGGFCNYGKDLNEIRTMHSNCCVGLQAKLHDLHMILDEWKNYTALPVAEREKGGFTWRVPGGICIH